MKCTDTEMKSWNSLGVNIIENIWESNFELFFKILLRKCNIFYIEVIIQLISS